MNEIISINPQGQVTRFEILRLTYVTFILGKLSFYLLKNLQTPPRSQFGWAGDNTRRLERNFMESSKLDWSNSAFAIREDTNGGNKEQKNLKFIKFESGFF